MRKILIISLLSGLTLLSVSFIREAEEASGKLRRQYAQTPGQWPAPFVDNNIHWTELGLLPNSPIEAEKEKLAPLITLGKTLFFDPRLSGSGKISCATCHQPELSWTDARERSIGHEGARNKRNAPTIQNSWFYTRLFWDGRAKDLADQAFGPINSGSEMHNDMHELSVNLNRIKGYAPLFRSAYGDAQATPDRIAEAIATFEKTIASRRSPFDEFLAGNHKTLSNDALKGLHLFRTKARCINCHNGPLFSDDQFHNNGFTRIDSSAVDDPAIDKGRYAVTHRVEDLGKYKTPSLRDVTRTGPWMHTGEQRDLSAIIRQYNEGAVDNRGADPLIRPLGLSLKEQRQLMAFLESISADPLPFQKPVLPQ